MGTMAPELRMSAINISSIVGELDISDEGFPRGAVTVGDVKLISESIKIIEIIALLMF
ncbi:MAG: hypothetical protein ACFFES_00480 [Candidatus Thorarchaeota archaeon]